MASKRTWTGVGLLAGAGLAAGAAVVSLSVASSHGAGPPSPAPSAAPVVVPTTPEPVAPSTAPVATSGPVAESAAATGPEPTPLPSTVPLSPLSSMVGAPVPVVPAPPTPAVAPTSISIEAMGITFPVRAVGLQPDGQLEIPDETEVGWYRLGAAPEEPGATVLAGHVSWNGVDGPFRELSTLEPGASVRLDLADGSTRQYQVIERTQYPKSALPADRIWATSGPETLVLITCGGDFNPEIRRYRDNIVVYAVPIS